MKDSCLRFTLTLTGWLLTAGQSQAQTIYEPYTFTTHAGLAGSSGSVDGTGSEARFNGPNAPAVDSDGNLYVPDQENHTIRRVNPAGVVTTVAGKAGAAGSADGTNNNARFYAPGAVAVDSAGNLFVTEFDNHTLRKVAPVGTNWVVTTLAGLARKPGVADGTNSEARFNGPNGVAVDSGGNIYVAEQFGNTVRQVTQVGTNWVVTTIAGRPGVSGSADGTNSTARFNAPGGVAVDKNGVLYVNDSGNTIRKVTLIGTNWVVTTIAGKAGVAGSADGTNITARFNLPSGVALDSSGNLFVTDGNNNTIRKMTQIGTNWVVTTLAGRAAFSGKADGTGSAARFIFPNGLAVDGAGNVYVSDPGNRTIRKGYPALVIASSDSTFGFAGGHFGFNLTGPTGNSVVVESSTDLVTWQPLWTNRLTGSLSYTDPQSSTNSDRFYRARIE